MQREEEDAGIDLAGMQLDDIADIASRIFDHVSSYPAEPRAPLDPTLAEANQRQREALLGAIAAHATEWPAEDQTVAAGMFDVLWSVATYERLVVDWQVDQKRAIRGIAWVIGLVEEAVRARSGSGMTRAGVLSSDRDRSFTPGRGRSSPPSTPSAGSTAGRRPSRRRRGPRSR